MLNNDILSLLNEKRDADQVWKTVLNLLASFSYEVQESDVILLVICYDQVENSIKINCNILEVPELIYIKFARGIVADFLTYKRSANAINIDNIDFDAVTSVTMGDTSISYNAADKPSAKFDALIEAMRNDLKGVFSCLRKIVF